MQREVKLAHDTAAERASPRASELGTESCLYGPMWPIVLLACPSSTCRAKAEGEGEEGGGEGEGEGGGEEGEGEGRGRGQEGAPRALRLQPLHEGRDPDAEGRGGGGQHESGPARGGCTPTAFSAVAPSLWPSCAGAQGA